jgi:hypothetical protein
MYPGYVGGGVGWTVAAGGRAVIPTPSNIHHCFSVAQQTVDGGVYQYYNTTRIQAYHKWAAWLDALPTTAQAEVFLTLTNNFAAASVGNGFSVAVTQAGAVILMAGNSSPNPYGVFTLSQIGTGTVVASSPGGVFIPGQWNKIAVYFNTGGSFSSGYASVWVNGVLVINAVNFQVAQNVSYIDSFVYWSFHPASGKKQIDDTYVNDTVQVANADIGTYALGADYGIIDLIPDADGHEAQWTPSNGTGPNWSLVDNNPPSENAAYIYSATDGQINLTEFPSISNTITVIGVVQPVVYADQDAAGSRTMDVMVSDGTTDVVVGVPYSMQNGVFAFCDAAFLDIDPITGTGWTQALVDALQAGAKVVT